MLLLTRKEGESLIIEVEGLKEPIELKTLAEYKYENKRLQMENELLRDFLQSTERR